MESFLEEFVLSSETGLQSVDRVWKRLKEFKAENPSNSIAKAITKTQLRQFIQNLPAYQIQRQDTSKKRFAKITARAVGDIIQTDLLDIQKYKKFNKNFAWIMTAVDVYSRYAWAFPLKTKSPKETAEVLDKIIKSYKDKGIDGPKNITSDNGKEFVGGEFKAKCKKLGIQQWTHPPGSHNTLGMIERFNRTVRDIIRKLWTSTQSRRWVNDLDKIIKGYNNTEHSATKSKPNDLITGKQAFSKEKKIPITSDNKTLQVGDKVRIRVKRGKLQKLEERYSKEVYTITKKNASSYRIADASGDDFGRTVKENEMLYVGNNATSLQQSDSDKKVAKELRKQKIKRALRKEGLE